MPRLVFEILVSIFHSTHEEILSIVFLSGSLFHAGVSKNLSCKLALKF